MAYNCVVIILLGILAVSGAMRPRNGCPGGKPIYCFANACTVDKCPRQSGSKCRPTCNGCIARFYDKWDNEITDKCQCPNGISQKSCPDVCKDRQCPRLPNAECRVNTCGRCKAIFYNKRGKQQNCEPDAACPNGGKVNCVVDACIHASCPRQTGAECRSTCNGCIAEFFDKFNNEITDQCQCPGRIFEAECKPDPCAGKSCPTYPTAQCRTNRCGGCNPIFYDESGVQVNCEIKDPRCPEHNSGRITICLVECNSNSDCSDGEICCVVGCRRSCVRLYEYDPKCPLAVAPVSNFPKIPCKPRLCTSNSDCRSDYMCCGLWCGSQCQPKPRPCPQGVYVAECSNVCKYAECPKHPKASCRVNECGGCTAEFYNEHNLIIKQCHFYEL